MLYLPEGSLVYDNIEYRFPDAFIMESFGGFTFILCGSNCRCSVILRQVRSNCQKMLFDRDSQSKSVVLELEAPGNCHSMPFGITTTNVAFYVQFDHVPL